MWNDNYGHDVVFKFVHSQYFNRYCFSVIINFYAVCQFLLSLTFNRKVKSSWIFQAAKIKHNIKNI